MEDWRYDGRDKWRNGAMMEGMNGDQTHPQQEIMLEFLPIYYFTPFPQKY